MRKVIINACTICLAIFLFSCNNSGEKKDTTDTIQPIVNEPVIFDTIDRSCISNGNFLVSEAWARPKIQEFEKMYKGPAPAGLRGSFWIDGCVLSAFDNFLQTPANINAGYDGIRFYSFAANDFTDIVMIPTKAKGDKHISQWGKLITLGTACDKTEFRNFNRTEKEMETNRKNFNDDYRNEKAPFGSDIRDSLSSGVWFNSCVIRSLMSYIGDKSLGLDGVRIYCIAYDKKYTGTLQRYLHQSSFVIVVTEAGGAGRHTDRWDVLDKKYKTDRKFRDGGYNHGQLCPTACE